MKKTICLSIAVLSCLFSCGSRLTQSVEKESSSTNIEITQGCGFNTLITTNDASGTTNSLHLTVESMPGISIYILPEITINNEKYVLDPESKPFLSKKYNETETIKIIGHVVKKSKLEEYKKQNPDLIAIAVEDYLIECYEKEEICTTKDNNLIVIKHYWNLSKEFAFVTGYLLDLSI